jgi:hypothetical protein
MRRREQDEDDSPYVFCDRCEQMSERALIQECPYCFKAFCRSCSTRSGSLAFCGKACADAWFFAESDDEDE